MRPGFTLAMARREARATRRRLWLYASAIAAGVAALVAIESFRASVDRGVHAQARTLLGADLELASRQPLDDAAEPLIRAFETATSPASYVTRFSSMALARPSRRTRLVWVHAIEGAYPFYGRIVTEPAGAWQPDAEEPRVLVDPAALIELDAQVGDTLVLGDVAFEIAGTVSRAPGGLGMRDAIAPRVFIAARHVDATRLLRPGSLARYAAYFRVDDPAALDATLATHRDALRAARVRSETVAEHAEELSDDLGRLTRFLGLVGLVALLLGGVGVATGVRVFVEQKLQSAAVLRCLGATQREVFAIYLLQALLLGAVGSALGVALGVGVQAGLPLVVRDFLPFDVAFRVHLPAVAQGLALGLWVTLLFALLPLLTLRGVPALRALRRDLESAPGAPDPLRRITRLTLGASVVAVSLWQAPSPAIGLWFAAGLLGSLGALALAATGLSRGARRLLPRSAPYWMRQGIANLFRPQNQTLAVTLALGVGVLLLALLHVVQRGLLAQLDLGRGPNRPNLAVFDIQLDQKRDVVALLAEHGAEILEQTPIVPARIAATRADGPQPIEEPVAQVDDDAARSEADGEPNGAQRADWARRREYRLTYRALPTDSEEIVSGRWWTPGSQPPDGVYRVSLEDDLAGDLGVAVGDHIVWDVQGVRVETRVANTRHVDWARFRTNFFAVFEPGILEQAPQSFVVLARLADTTARAELQGTLVERFPNVSVLDATHVLRALDALLGRVALAIRFMALFALASGLGILAGALATSRQQRARESVLLRTLGASSSCIRRILATEYFALGALAGIAGVSLACVGAQLVLYFTFAVSAPLPVAELCGIALATALASTAIGLSHSRGALRGTPLVGLREVDAEPRSVSLPTPDATPGRALG